MRLPVQQTASLYTLIRLKLATAPPPETPSGCPIHRPLASPAATRTICPEGEAARIYIDPDHEFAHFLQGTNMKLVVSIDGRSYDQSAQAVTTQYQATLPRTGSNNHCNNGNTRSCPALSQTFSFTFNLSLVATGKLPDPLPALAGRTINKVFVVDGIGGINACGTNCSTSRPAKILVPR